MRVSLLLPLLALLASLVVGTMSSRFICTAPGCSYTSLSKYGIAGHKKKHLKRSVLPPPPAEAGIFGLAIAGGAGHGEGGGCEGDGGGEDWAESESEGAPVEEPVLDELAMDGDDGEGGEADAHDAAAAAADAAADAAALAAAKAALAVAQPLPALPADAQIAAASLGVHRPQLRAMHEGFQQSLLAKPGMLFNLAVSEAFATAGLSERDRNAMRRWYTSGVGAACSGCPCPNHTSQVLWGEQRRATAVSMQVECDSLCAPLFLTITRNDSSLGENSKELELVNIIFSLRGALERLARSYAHAPGSFVYLDGTGEIDVSGGCVGLCDTELLLQGAAAAHKSWNESAGKPLLTAWASNRGYNRILLVPCPLRAAEDGTNTTTRTKVDAVHIKPDNLAPHCMNHDHFVLLSGLISKPPWKEGALPKENAAWAETSYQQSLAEAYGLTQLMNWDKDGLLLVDRFPGLSLQPPEGEKWLFVLSPYLSGISGDLQGCYKAFGLKQNVSCPFCVVPSAKFNVDTCDTCERWDPNVVAFVEHHRKKYAAGSPAEKRTAGVALTGLGINPDVKTCFDWVSSFGESWRVPHTTKAVATPYRYYAIDVLHVRFTTRLPLGSLNSPHPRLPSPPSPHPTSCRSSC